MSLLRVACVQMTAGDDMAANIRTACDGVARVAGQGAQLVSLPEYASLLDARSKVMLAGAFAEADHPALHAFRDLAARQGIMLHIGSLTVQRAETGRPVNRSYLIGPEGAVLARYDKINLFDLTLEDGRELFESRVYDAGTQAVAVQTPRAALGLTICYDLRFPPLFRHLAEVGAEVILVPAAFLRVTGPDHWHSLLRARAIDTGAFIVAAAMCGTSGGGRESYGHSLIVDPWGRVLADGGNGPGEVLADLDLSLVAQMRARNPWLKPPAVFTPAAAPADRPASGRHAVGPVPPRGPG